MDDEHIAVKPQFEPVEAACGYFLTGAPGLTTLHMSASPAHLRAMRALVAERLAAVPGAEDTLGDTVSLLASELVANAVRLFGPWVPVVVQIDTRDGDFVLLRVHDPARTTMPCRASTSPDDPDAETGRGLRILDALAPGWTVEPTPHGKAIMCRVPRPTPAEAAMTRPATLVAAKATAGRTSW